MITLIYQDLIIEFESTEDLFDDPIVQSYQQKFEREHRIEELYEQHCLLLIRRQRYISRIEKDLGFSLNDDDATEKLKSLSDTINIPEVLYQYAA